MSFKESKDPANISDKISQIGPDASQKLLSSNSNVTKQPEIDLAEHLKLQQLDYKDVDYKSIWQTMWTEAAPQMPRFNFNDARKLLSKDLLKYPNFGKLYYLYKCYRVSNA